MTLKEQFRQHPMTWRDYVSAAGVFVTVATMLVQGGRLIEEVKVTNNNVTALRMQVTSLQQEQIRVATELERLRGVDSLHEEQIRAVRRDMDIVQRVKGR